jgi:hypothetical protein
MSERKLVLCWNCKHLKTVHQGQPRDGRLFAETVKKCAIHGTVFKERYEVLVERECKDHIRFGLLEKPLGA